jgi:hypothetical protein
MGQFAALIVALAKAMPAVERLLTQVVDLYAAWKKDQNTTDEKSKDARNAAAIAAARGGLRQLCPACPFAGDGAGQHGPAYPAPAIPSSGRGSA